MHISMKRALPRILVTGKNGQVGHDLCFVLKGRAEVTAIDIEDVDFTDPSAIERAVVEARPDLVMNPAAYTAVDRAEQEPDLARSVNAAAPGVIAAQARQLGIPVIHYSTDYVFDGDKKDPYTEDDAPNPQTVYGRTKLDGENAVRESGADFIILRLAWVYAVRGSNFMLTMLRLGSGDREIRVVDDQYGSPTWSRMIAAASADIAMMLLDGKVPAGNIFHLTAEGRTNWYDYAMRIFELAVRSRILDKMPVVKPVSTAEYAAPAARPESSVLSCKKLEKMTGIALPSWDEQLEKAIRELSL